MVVLHPKRGHRLTAKELSDRGTEHSAPISKPENQTFVKVFDDVCINVVSQVNHDPSTLHLAESTLHQAQST